MKQPVEICAAFSPSGLFKLVRNNEGDCWEALCELQNSTIDILKRRGYRVHAGEFVETYLRATGRRIPDLTDREHVCKFQGAVISR